MVNVLCNGPKFNENQSNRLSSLLYQMQNIFTGTQICIPKFFDVCLNLDQIWDFTYIRHPNNHMNKLLMDELDIPRFGNILILFLLQINIIKTRLLLIKHLDRFIRQN